VAGVTQSDGTSLSFTYVLVNGTYRVATATDGLGKVTQYGYDTANGKTTVTDPLGVSTVCAYDGSGRLLQVKSGVTASNAAGLTQLVYTYNALGDVATIADGLRTVTMQYDASGNLVSQSDGAGNTVTRTYNGQNQVVTETAYAGASQTQPLTTRYVYDAGNKNLLRYVVTAEGRVTEYRYSGQGLRVATIEYEGGAYDVSGLGVTGVPTEAQLASWAAGQDLTRTDRTDYGYDFRGQLQTSTTYGSVDASGAGVASTKSQTQYVYNQRGELLQTITPDTKGVRQSIYDGLGRVVWTQARSSDGALTTTTTTVYDDANGKTAVTYANGLSATSAYDQAGRLVSVVQSGSGQSNLGTTKYAYDADGRLLMVEGPTGQRSFVLYDEAGRKVGEVDAAGRLTEYVYDASSRVTQTIGYATPVDTSKLITGGAGSVTFGSTVWGGALSGVNANTAAPCTSST
jgi:YD repeat-containing protein